MSPPSNRRSVPGWSGRRGRTTRTRRIKSAAPGFSFIELLFVTALIGVLSAVAIPQMAAGLDHWRTAAAVRFVSSRLYEARTEAAALSTNIAIRFVGVNASYEFAVFADGNDNGIRAADIAKGIDREIHRPQRLIDQFPGVDFGANPGLPPVDPGGGPPGDDPIRLGASDMVVFTALGSSSSGSLYIKGRSRAQYVIRIFGDTGKIRVLKFDPASGQWKAL